MIFYLTVFVILFLAIGCEENKNIEDKIVIRSLSFGFETSLEDWETFGGSGERMFENDIIISNDISSEGDKSCQFTVSSESIVAGGNRAELTFDQRAIQGDITWYEWSFYLPTDYHDVELKDENNIPNWQVIGQWHQQPVFNEGENWDFYTGIGDSPPIAVYYNYFSTDDSHYQTALLNPEIISIYGFDTTWNNKSTITISYGHKSIAVSEINKGEWIQLKFNIKWSENDDGYIQVWKNGTEITNGKTYGANMLNKASHYFKFGLYRNPEISFTQMLYYDNILIL